MARGEDALRPTSRAINARRPTARGEAATAVGEPRRAARALGVL